MGVQVFVLQEGQGGELNPQTRSKSVPHGDLLHGRSPQNRLQRFSLEDLRFSLGIPEFVPSSGHQALPELGSQVLVTR